MFCKACENLWFIPRNSQFSLTGLKDKACNFHQQEGIWEEFWAHLDLVVAQVSSHTPAALQAVVCIKKNWVATAKVQHILLS